jgi:hypothetical protein
VRQHEIALEVGQLFRRNADRGELTEAGIDPVNRVVALKDVGDRLLARIHARPGLGVERDRRAITGDLAQPGQLDRARAQNDLLSSCHDIGLPLPR